MLFKNFFFIFYDFVVGSSGKNLVRYITVEMVRKLAKEDQLEHIKSLTFSLSGEKKIRVMFEDGVWVFHAALVYLEYPLHCCLHSFSLNILAMF